VEVEFCSDRRIRALNSEWREKSKATDVLSFPTFDVSFTYCNGKLHDRYLRYLTLHGTSHCSQFTAPERFTRESKEFLKLGRQLGDIVIAPSYVQKQCDEDRDFHEVPFDTVVL
jgi:ssRNA-specific RNase YbeY (16S rRNA maturation enzyme)